MPRETKRPQEPIEPEKLPELTHNETGFVRNYLAGNTASDAYRAAYNVENMSDAAIWVEASRVKARPNVSLWLRRASEENLTECKVTLDSHTAELDRLSRLAENAGAYGASIKAQELRGRANGLYVDRIKTENDEANLLELLKVLSPPVRKAILEDLGLEMPENSPDSDTPAQDNLVELPDSTLRH